MNESTKDQKIDPDREIDQDREIDIADEVDRKIEEGKFTLVG